MGYREVLLTLIGVPLAVRLILYLVETDSEPTLPENTMELNESLYWYKAELMRVIDGDTVVVSMDLGFQIRQLMHLRLYGINTPELIGPKAAAARAATDFLVHTLAQGPLLVRSYKDRADKYGGRFLAELFVQQSDGTLVNVNQLLVSTGHAVPYNP